MYWLLDDLSMVTEYERSKSGRIKVVLEMIPEFFFLRLILTVEYN